MTMFKRAMLAILIVGGSGMALWASGATFAVTGSGISLGQGKDVDDGGKEIHRFVAKTTVGTPFSLTAQGIVLPRGGKPAPGEPDSGAWTFDAKTFKKLNFDGAADKTKINVRLEPTAAGMARVRFVGVILGYERTIEVLIDVAEKAPAK